MSRTIHKYGLTTGINVLPKGKVVLVGWLNHDDDVLPTIWIEYDPNDAQHTDQYVIVGTGHSVWIDMEHVGSAICGRFVWHVYKAV